MVWGGGGEGGKGEGREGEREREVGKEGGGEGGREKEREGDTNQAVFQLVCGPAPGDSCREITRSVSKHCQNG